ncbi:ribosome small subunit-dependent GTPase A [Alloiococcus sp. CFN-8]|uniref:ribosome small subunit-dependent GTPase A n=1 Tax=Alloiococcus sp. CFN-8 TaxID=3416081 RepID=UPI003CF854B0
MNKIDIKNLGFNNKFFTEASLYKNLYPGRVVFQSKNIYRVICEYGDKLAQISGKFHYEAKTPSDFPAVGDFVMLSGEEAETAVIHHVLSRKSAFIRKAAGTSQTEQVVATNIDTLFICMSMNKDFNLRRLERYLAIGWDSGAIPVVVLTKSDLCEDVPKLLREAYTVSTGVDIVVTSVIQEDGYRQLTPYIKKGETIAFIGSSGVGKSTLINCLMGEDKQITNGLRNDDKGKHTTTSRELILLKDGSLIIDTPGMRELGLDSADLSKSFSDIDNLAAMCKFNDCTHTKEPGCAVQKAINEGILSYERLLSYEKLKKESKYNGLNSRQIEAMKVNEMFRGYGGMKNARRLVKEKNKRR